ncbi:MAG: nitronate monooxygenase [Bacteroidetes bacterium]|nr:nitronate monooxygenase [Bacteroidota bacterium]
MAAFSNRITELFGIDYPIIQAGMVWASGWRLASAVSNAGGLGLIGSGSMHPDVLKEHIRSCKVATNKPFGVNIPLLYPEIEKHIETVIEEDVKIIFTSAGNPNTWTRVLKDKGKTVVHVISSSRFAKKAEDAGCDAIVAEGFEAGGHNGREETTTMVLIPAVCKSVKIPVISAGGIATGRQMFAAMVLGAEGAQFGTRFVASEEASSHISFKQKVIASVEGDTMLMMKKTTPVRLLKNFFSQQVQQAENSGASTEELNQLLGRGRAKRGMFEGDLENGELEIGQVSSLINEILPAVEIVKNLWSEFLTVFHNPLTNAKN